MSDNRPPAESAEAQRIEVALARLDERQVAFMQLMDSRIRDLQNDVEEVRTGMKNFVTMDKFKPTQMIAYGAVSLILTGFLTGLIALLVKLPK